MYVGVFETRFFKVSLNFKHSKIERKSVCDVFMLFQKLTQEAMNNLSFHFKVIVQIGAMGS